MACSRHALTLKSKGQNVKGQDHSIICAAGVGLQVSKTVFFFLDVACIGEIATEPEFSCFDASFSAQVQDNYFDRCRNANSPAVNELCDGHVTM